MAAGPGDRGCGRLMRRLAAMLALAGIGAAPAAAAPGPESTAGPAAVEIAGSREDPDRLEGHRSASSPPPSAYRPRFGRKADGDPVDGNVGVFSLALPEIIDRVGVRHATAVGDTFGDLTQQAAYIDFRLPWYFVTAGGLHISPRLTLEGGRFENGGDDRLFASLGPAVRLSNPRWRLPLVLDAGISPTFIDGSEYDGREFGTSINFTSHLALGLELGERNRYRIDLRFQHISNGGLNDDNPGVNMFGIGFSVGSR